MILFFSYIILAIFVLGHAMDVYTSILTNDGPGGVKEAGGLWHRFLGNFFIDLNGDLKVKRAIVFKSIWVALFIILFHYLYFYTSAGAISIIIVISDIFITWETVFANKKIIRKYKK